MSKQQRGRRMLGTRVIGIEYNFCDHSGRIHMDRGCCVDMGDCINFCRRIDQDVTFICTIAGIKEDTSYRRSADGKWEASYDGQRYGAVNG
jgi:hypothetical protein